MKDEWYDDVFGGGYEFSEEYFSVSGGSESDTATLSGLRSSDNKVRVQQRNTNGINGKKAKIKNAIDYIEEKLEHRFEFDDEHTDLTLDLFDVQDELAHILITKHSDYGSKNISDAPGGALNGIRVRMHDKVARLNNLIDNKKEPKHESIRDTLIDIANYATIAIMVIDDKWDK